jgi:ribosomal protein S3AE
MRWMGHVTSMTHKKCIQNFKLKTFRKDILRRIRRRWENNIKMDPKEIGCEGEDRIRISYQIFYWISALVVLQYVINVVCYSL